MSSGPWTIDTIAHALPLPDLRQNFLRETHLASIDELPHICRKWADLVERYEAAQPGAEALLEYAKTHNGQTPPEYADADSTESFFDRLADDVHHRHSQGSNAA